VTPLQISDEARKCAAYYQHSFTAVQQIEIAVRIQRAINDATARLEQENRDLKAVVDKRYEELLHNKFFFQPHPDDAKKCNCAYCARYFEAIAEHAANLEMNEHSLENLVKQLEHGCKNEQCGVFVKCAESERDALKQRVKELELQIERDTECITRCQTAGMTAEVERDTLKKRLAEVEKEILIFRNLLQEFLETAKLKNLAAG